MDNAMAILSKISDFVSEIFGYIYDFIKSIVSDSVAD